MVEIRKNTDRRHGQPTLYKSTWTIIAASLILAIVRNRWQPLNRQNIDSMIFDFGRLTKTEVRGFMSKCIGYKSEHTIPSLAIAGLIHKFDTRRAHRKAAVIGRYQRIVKYLKPPTCWTLGSLFSPI